MEITGLTTAQAKRKLQEVGPNVLERQRSISVFRLLANQFTSPLIMVLVIAAGLSMLLHEVVDAAVISLAVLMNAVLGFVQEFKAQRALEALSKVLHPEVKVIRDGKHASVLVSELVPGDVVYLEAGDQIPADGVFVGAHQVSINEAVLTGESAPVRKKATDTEYSSAVAPQDPAAVNFGYLGTTCVTGKAEMLVLSTGARTQVGQIAVELSQTKEHLTPLQKKVRNFSYRIGVLVTVLALIVFVLGVSQGWSWQMMYKLSIAIAVSAVPEGLLISLTVILAVGMQRILAKKALVRKLVAAETLGSVTVVCTDKTGTLTEGKLTVSLVSSQHKQQMKQIGMLMNSATDPLEIAVRQWVGAQSPQLKPSSIEDEVVFTAERKSSLKMTSDEVIMIGAPEIVLKHCTLSEHAEFHPRMLAFAQQGYRLVGVAARVRKKTDRTLDVNLPGRLKWVGFFVFSDPIRKDVKRVLKRITAAHIDVKVITGDFAETALAVMEELGMKLHSDQVMLGSEFLTLPLSEIKRKIPKVRLFARTTPQQKLQIVRLLQEAGEVVAMTGDGVNDAPALKQADIGIVVSSASDVSKETADLVLLDDNFKTIVAAIEEGRNIFINIRKVVLFLISNSFAETLMLLGALALHLPLPITALQILWVNLATDGLPAMALTVEPKEKGLLKQPPVSTATQLINRPMAVLIGLISSVSALGISLVIYLVLPESYSLIHKQTVAFTLLAVMSLCVVFSSRKLSEPLWHGLFENLWLWGAVAVGFALQVLVVYHPLFQKVFETVALNLYDWGVIALASVGLLALIEGVKFLLARRFFQSPAAAKT